MYLFMKVIDINIGIQKLVTMAAVDNKRIVTEINHFFNNNLKYMTLIWQFHFVLLHILVNRHLATNHLSDSVVDIFALEQLNSLSKDLVHII